MNKRTKNLSTTCTQVLNTLSGFYRHTPALLRETVEQLNLSKGKKVIDATAGLGGHSGEILEKIAEEGIRLLAIDADNENLKIAKENLKKYKDQIIFVHSNFRNIKETAEGCGFKEVDAILFDLGLSSSQLDDETRGFSFRKNGPLDMRFGRAEGVKGVKGVKGEGITAEKIVNRFRKEELIEIFKKFGEVHNPYKIADAIIEERRKKPIETTFELRDAIQKATPWPRPASAGRPSTKEIVRVFQAIRIAVNDELNSLEKALRDSVSLLKSNGRIAVLSYHSLEDRLVKNIFRYYTKKCVCDYPICRCDIKPKLKIITKKPIRPSEEEIRENSRSRSAKLRVAERRTKF